MNNLNIPLALTLSRLILSPIIIPILFSYFLPLKSLEANLFLVFVFMCLSLTDFFDGYLARRLKKETVIGGLLDPIADKFLLLCTLITLVGLGKIFYYWAIIFIGREILVMGLRQLSLYYGFNLSVINIAKYKTAAQMIYLAFVIFNPYQNLGFFNLFNIIQTILLIIALNLTLFSAIAYTLIFLKNLKGYNDI